MSSKNFTTTTQVDQSPKEAFEAITNVRGWWSEEIDGSTDKLSAEFKYHFEDVHRCKIRVTEFVPNEKIVWLIVDNYFKFTSDHSEWTGTQVSFEIFEKNGKTHIRVTHIGLVPEYECFKICSNAWTHYIQESLTNLIATGKGQPNAKGKPATDDERKLTA